MRYDLEQYVALCNSLLEGKLTAVEFQNSVLRLSREDRAAEDAERASWPRRVDVELQTDYLNGLMSPDEFSRRWRELWGITPEELRKSIIIGEIFSAVDQYCSEP